MMNFLDQFWAQLCQLLGMTGRAINTADNYLSVAEAESEVFAELQEMSREDRKARRKAQLKANMEALS